MNTLKDKVAVVTGGGGGIGRAIGERFVAEGMKVERISSTLDDAGIAAARRYSIEDVSRLFGVPTSYLSEHELGNETETVTFLAGFSPVAAMVTASST